MIIKLLFLLFVSSLALPAPPVYAADTTSEDAYHAGNTTGSAGWDLGIGYDEELDELTDEQKARVEELRRKQEAEAKEKQQKNNDFFSSCDEEIDRRISETPEKEEK